MNSWLKRANNVSCHNLVLDPGQLARVEYTRLVRKGGHEATWSHGSQFGVAARPVLSDMAGSCLGLMTGYRFDLRTMSLRARIDYCASTAHNSALEANRHDLSLSLAAEHTWNSRHASPFVGAGLGLTSVLRTFDSEGRAPALLSSSPLGFLVLGATMPLTCHTYWGGDGRLEADLIRYQETAFDGSQLRVLAGARSTLFVGLQFSAGKLRLLGVRSSRKRRHANALGPANTHKFR